MLRAAIATVTISFVAGIVTSIATHVVWSAAVWAEIIAQLLAGIPH